MKGGRALLYRDREDLEQRPEFPFTHRELGLIVQAAKGDSDIKKVTTSKLETLWRYARAMDAYGTKKITISAK